MLNKDSIYQTLIDLIIFIAVRLETPAFFFFIPLLFLGGIHIHSIDTDMWACFSS